jgi:hypothetical protein
VGVDVLRIDLEDVAAAPCHDELVRLEGLAEPRHLDVEAVRRCSRRSLRPERLDELVARDDLVRAEQEQREQRPGLRAAYRHGAAVPERFDRSQEAELHGPPSLGCRRR